MNDDRWLLQPPHELTPEERQQIWKTVHGRGYRTEEVWSVTADRGFRRRLLKNLRALPFCRRILLPGCGSLTHLQEEILSHCAQVESIVCTDLPEAIEHAKAQLNHPKVAFHAVDSTQLHHRWPEHFDVVIPINSVVSSDDEENRSMLRSFSRALRKSGYLLGIFPCIYAVQELYRFTPPAMHHAISQREAVDLDARTLTWFPADPELPAAMPQLFYSVNDLRIIFAEAGFDLSTLDMTIDVLADDGSRAILEKWYQIHDRRICLWNLMITAAKAMAE